MKVTVRQTIEVVIELEITEDDTEMIERVRHMVTCDELGHFSPNFVEAKPTYSPVRVDEIAFWQFSP